MLGLLLVKLTAASVCSVWEGVDVTLCSDVDNGPVRRTATACCLKTSHIQYTSHSDSR